MPDSTPNALDAAQLRHRALSRWDNEGGDSGFSLIRSRASSSTSLMTASLSKSGLLRIAFIRSHACPPSFWRRVWERGDEIVSCHYIPAIRRIVFISLILVIITIFPS